MFTQKVQENASSGHCGVCASSRTRCSDSEACPTLLRPLSAAVAASEVRPPTPVTGVPIKGTWHALQLAWHPSAPSASINYSHLHFRSECGGAELQLLCNERFVDMRARISSQA